MNPNTLNELLKKLSVKWDNEVFKELESKAKELADQETNLLNKQSILRTIDIANGYKSYFVEVLGIKDIGGVPEALAEESIKIEELEEDPEQVTKEEPEESQEDEEEDTENQDQLDEEVDESEDPKE